MKRALWNLVVIPGVVVGGGGWFAANPSSGPKEPVYLEEGTSARYACRDAIQSTYATKGHISVLNAPMKSGPEGYTIQTQAQIQNALGLYPTHTVYCMVDNTGEVELIVNRH